MTPDEKSMLAKSYDLAQENNKILRGMLSRARWGNFFRLVYWLIILALALGAFYYVKPYFDMMVKTYQSVTSDINNIKNITTKLPSTIGGYLTK